MQRDRPVGAQERERHEIALQCPGKHRYLQPPAEPLV
jgi:hypothetical protein